MKKITLVQKVATLDECLEMINNGELPIVIELTEQESHIFSGNTEMLNLMKKVPKLFPKVVPEKEKLTSKDIDDSLKYNMASIYYGNFKTTDGYVYNFISNKELMELIKNKKIYINDFIDFYGNKRCVFSLYPGSTSVKTGGILFKNILKVYGETKDSGKLKNMPVVSGITEVKDINYAYLTQRNHIEMEDLCLETVKLTEKQNQNSNPKTLIKNQNNRK